MPRFLCPTATSVTVALRAHPTVPRNLTPEQAFKSDTGVLHDLSSGDPTLSVRYWITNISILQTFARNRLEAGYDIIYYTPFSSEAARTHVHPLRPNQGDKSPNSYFPSLIVVNIFSSDNTNSTWFTYKHSGPDSTTNCSDATIATTKRDDARPNQLLFVS